MSFMSNLEFFVFAAVTLFAIIGPISAAPAFLAMTPSNTKSERVGIARMGAIVGGSVMVLFALFGQWALSVLGITIPAFQVAGGMLLFLIALDMIHAKSSTRRTTKEEKEEAAERDDVAITPVGVPLICGPGAISSCILLSNEATNLLQQGALLVAILLVASLSFVTFALAARGADWLNPLLLKVTQRLMGLLLSALAVQFVFNGLTAIGVISPLK